MNHYEDEIVRLNRKLNALMQKTELTIANNFELDSEHEKLKIQYQELKNDYAKSSQQNIEQKIQLDKMINENDELNAANRKLKTRLNQLSVKCGEKDDKIKVLQTNLQKLNSNRMSTISEVSIVSHESRDSSSSNSTELSDDFIDGLQNKIKQLEDELEEAHHTIEDMDFELSSIDYLESENKRLQDEINKYKGKINSQQDNSHTAVNYGKKEEETIEEEREDKDEECGTDSQGKEFNKNKNVDFMEELRQKQEQRRSMLHQIVDKNRKSHKFHPL